MLGRRVLSTCATSTNCRCINLISCSSDHEARVLADKLMTSRVCGLVHVNEYHYAHIMYFRSVTIISYCHHQFFSQTLNAIDELGKFMEILFQFLFFVSLRPSSSSCAQSDSRHLILFVLFLSIAFRLLFGVAEFETLTFLFLRLSFSRSKFIVSPKLKGIYILLRLSIMDPFGSIHILISFSLLFLLRFKFNESRLDNQVSGHTFFEWTLHVFNRILWHFELQCVCSQETGNTIG